MDENGLDVHGRRSESAQGGRGRRPIELTEEVLATFTPLLLCGVSLNIMSLGGLALGIGMLVDSAIVVLESVTCAL